MPHPVKCLQHRLLSSDLKDKMQQNDIYIYIYVHCVSMHSCRKVGDWFSWSEVGSTTPSSVNPKLHYFDLSWTFGQHVI